jgi:hypothetical protein
VSGSDEVELDPKVPGVAKPGAAESVVGAGGVEPSGALDGPAEIAAALASGQIDAAAAQQLLIESVLGEQFADLGPEQVERMRAQLTELLADDPTLASLLDPI